jgi:pterin-4a-carbinolamine dehydratase
VTPSNLPEVIRTYQGNRFDDLDDCELLLPPSFRLIKEDDRVFIRKEIQFQDFKEAFSFFNFIASTFNRLYYRPQIFNVYNKIVVEFTDPNYKVPTTKEIFMTRFLAELINNPRKAAEKTLEALNTSEKNNQKPE